MANVDKCVRECEAALCSDNIDKNVNAILSLPDNEKVRILRGKTKNEITDFLNNCKRFIKLQIAHSHYGGQLRDFEKYVLSPTSNNNKDGADVFHILPNKQRIEIEVKFGAKTDKAIGMKVFENIFGTNIFSQTLLNSIRDGWKNTFIRENYDGKKQFARLFLSLNNAIAGFNDHIKRQGYTLNPSEQTYMEKEIINNSGAGKGTAEYYMKFSFETMDPKEIKTIQTGRGQWKICEVKKLDSSASIARVNVFVKNTTTNTQIKYTLNWKNDYEVDANKGKVSAKLGFGSPSWNVWVDEVSKL